MKVLITGGTGFLGRRIVEETEKNGDVVIAPRSAQFNLETGEGVPTLLRREKPDVIIHSAAYYGGIGICHAEPLNLAVKNLRMAATVFEQAVLNGVSAVVSVGSACAYPGYLEGDLYERDFFNGRCHESVEAYGYSKRAQLVLLAAAKKQHGIRGVQLALSNLYGEYDVYHEYRSHAIAALIRKVAEAKLNNGMVRAWGSGKPIRQFVYVGDAARVITRAVRMEADDELINVGGEEISIRDLTYKIADVVGLPHDRVEWDASKPDGVMRKVINDDTLHRLFPDYAPLSLDEGLSRTVKWYMENKAEADERR